MRFRFTTTTLILWALPVLASAHHSRAEFSAEIQEIEGELVAIAWRNPHPVLTLKVVNAAGEEELWGIESWSSANSLLRKGVNSDAFTVGQRITAAVRASNRRENLWLGTSISLGNGTQAVLRPGYEPYWPDQAVLGSEAAALPRDRAVAAIAQEQRLFRIWTFIDRTGVADLPLTEAAVQRQAEFDELSDHPMWKCDPVGMPVAMDTGLPIEFVDQGDDIILRIEQNDGVRTIHLNPDPHANEQPATVMGYSVGRWDGDTLIVTTNNSSYFYFDDDGTPKSETMEITERFSLGADGRSLSWEATMIDPVFFTEPVVLRANWEWIPGETIEPWNCAVSGSLR